MQTIRDAAATFRDLIEATISETNVNQKKAITKVARTGFQTIRGVLDQAAVGTDQRTIVAAIQAAIEVMDGYEHADKSSHLK